MARTFQYTLKEAGIRGLYSKYQTRAKSHKRLFDLSRAVFTELILDRCYYCNSKPRTKWYVLKGDQSTRGTFLYNGIDRVDNELGYIEGNVLTCCYRCNVMKHILNYGDFIKQVHKIAAHRSAK